MKCHNLLLCSVFLVVNCPREPFCLFMRVNIVVFVIWWMILLILPILFFDTLNKTLGFLNNSWFPRCFISVDSRDRIEGKCSADLNLPDTLTPTSLDIEFRMKYLCVGGKRKHWFGFDFLKLSMLILCPTLFYFCFCLFFLSFHFLAWNMVLMDSLAFLSDMTTFDFLTLLFSWD